MKCPGQDSRYWKPGAIFEVECPQCGHPVEFFKDDTTRRCRKCGHRFLNPGLDFGCASYCKYAEQCIGNLPPELIAQKEDLLKDRVAIEMKRYFKKDFRRVGHAGRVARYAERIAKKEGGDLAVILAAAYLHDAGIKEAEKNQRDDAAEVHEQEGPPVAKDILERLGAAEGMIEEVCDIIGHHHHPRSEETNNFKCVYDADQIANLEEKNKKSPMILEELDRTIDQSLLTKTGRDVAREVLLSGA
jgi:HD superfamily phosphohydrolase YqeK